MYISISTYKMENPTKTAKSDQFSIVENSNVCLTNMEVLAIGAREIEKANTHTYMSDLGVFNVIFRLMKSKGIITLNDTVHAFQDLKKTAKTEEWANSGYYDVPVERICRIFEEMSRNGMITMYENGKLSPSLSGFYFNLTYFEIEV